MRQVLVVMPCFLATTFSPSFRSMMYFFLQSSMLSDKMLMQMARVMTGLAGGLQQPGLQALQTAMRSKGTAHSDASPL